jgi:hypothetical protein
LWKNVKSADLKLQTKPKYRSPFLRTRYSGSSSLFVL